MVSTRFVAVPHKYTNSRNHYMVSTYTKGQHTMLDFLIAYLVNPIMQRQFKNTEQQQLDRYITSKNPSTAAEVDYWAREWDRKQTTQGWL